MSHVLVNDLSSNRDTVDHWDSYQLILSNFLSTEDTYLIVARDNLSMRILLECNPVEYPQVDLLQFYKIANFRRGELGIREIRWKFSNYLVNSNFLKNNLSDTTKLGALLPDKFLQRYIRMQNRYLGLRKLMGDLADIGIAIPNYIEPHDSTIVLSRKFAQSLLEFNSSGKISFYRAIFAIARSSNHICIRVTGY